MVTYVNDLRLSELATGEGSGTWGTTTNTNLQLIGEALGYGTQNCFSSDANATTTVADGSTDPARAMYFKVTSSATLSATRELTIAPNTVNRVMIIENATTGSQIITIKQGSGNTVNVGNGAVKVLYLDGAGSGAAVQDALVDLDLTGTTTAATVTASGVITGLTVEATGDTAAGDNAAMGYTSAEGLILTGQGSSTDVTVKNDADATVMSIATGTTTVAFAGNIDVDGTTNLDAVDIDGAVQIDSTVTVGADDTGYDVKFFGATASAYMLWDESADDLILAGAARVVVPASGLVIGSTAVTSTAAELNVLDPALKESDSIYIGSDPSGTTDTANYNTAFGTSALDGITTGDNNTAVGRAALTDLTTASYTTAIGAYAGEKVSTGSGEGTFVGAFAGEEVTTGVSNTAIGYNAGGGASASASTADHNTSVGHSALEAVTSGHSNVVMGKNAALSLTESDKTTAIGAFALDALTTADDNTAVGYGALSANTSPEKNTAVGSAAMTANTTGGYATAVGFQALSSTLIDHANTAVGYEALEDLNASAGGAAVWANNTALGYRAGANATEAIQGVFVGSKAGDEVTTGDGVVCIGFEAGGSDAAGTGSYNTSVGHRSGYVLAAGANNTFIGKAAGYAVEGGDNNLLLGKDAGRTGSPGGNIVSADNYLVLGDESIASANIQVDWTVASDARDKTDFTALDLGLDFVKALKPVTYKWDKRSKYGDKTAADYDLNAQTPDGTHKEDWLDIGFKAQEVEALEIAAGYTKDNKTNLVSSHSDDGNQMGLQYTKFVPILVKAIQEQQAVIESLTARIAALES